MEQDKEDQLKSQLKDILDKIETVFNKSESQVIIIPYFKQSPEKSLTILQTKTYGRASLSHKTIENWHDLGVSY